VGVGIDISARKRAEEARLAIEARYHTLFEHAPDGIVIADAESVYLDANASMCRMLGYRRDELIGLHARDIVVQSEVAHIEPALDVIRARRDYHREWLFRRQDGSVFPAEVIATTMPDGNLMGMIRNITERKQAATRLAESERQYRELVELANSIILRWNSEGVITFLNDYGQRFFGYTAEEIHGRHVVGTLVPETDTNGRNMEPLMDQICATPEAFQDNTNENMRRNGERVWVAWTNRILRDANGRPVEILSVGADITRQHQAEVALRELNETLEHRVAERTAEMQEAVARAEAADRIKSAFLATMSHELRTPLNSIIGFTGILLQGLAGPLNPEQSKQLGMVRNSSRHLLELINDVLDISKIEANQLEMAALPFDLPESLARVVALIRPAAEKKGLELLVQVQPGLGRMTGDRRRVEQILLNLLNNAVKFTDHGKVTLTAEAVPDYHPATSAAAIPAVRLRVADTGLGIQPADLATLFQPFRQVDTGLARQHEGTGLGLAICRRLATLMGGEIFAVSEWSRGSEFTVILPLKRTHRP
jgi:PAS domain S-box-containing protein